MRRGNQVPPYFFSEQKGIDVDINEIQKCLAGRSSKSVCIDRCVLTEYVDTVREIYILKENRVRLEFNCNGDEDGGLSYYLKYNNLDDLVASLEDYLETQPSHRLSFIDLSG
jgi:hypothetical protein